MFIIITNNFTVLKNKSFIIIKEKTFYLAAVCW